MKKMILLGLIMVFGLGLSGCVKGDENEKIEEEFIFTYAIPEMERDFFNLENDTHNNNTEAMNAIIDHKLNNLSEGTFLGVEVPDLVFNDYESNEGNCRIGASDFLCFTYDKSVLKSNISFESFLQGFYIEKESLKSNVKELLSDNSDFEEDVIFKKENIVYDYHAKALVENDSIHFSSISVAFGLESFYFQNIGVNSKGVGVDEVLQIREFQENLVLQYGYSVDDDYAYVVKLQVTPGLSMQYSRMFYNIEEQYGYSLSLTKSLRTGESSVQSTIYSKQDSVLYREVSSKDEQIARYTFLENDETMFAYYDNEDVDSMIYYLKHLSGFDEVHVFDDETIDPIFTLDNENVRYGELRPTTNGDSINSYIIVDMDQDNKLADMFNYKTGDLSLDKISIEEIEGTIEKYSLIEDYYVVERASFLRDDIFYASSIRGFSQLLKESIPSEIIELLNYYCELSGSDLNAMFK